MADTSCQYLPMDADLSTTLLSPEFSTLLQATVDATDKTSLQVSTRLRQAGYSPDLIALALTQNRLRLKARAKLGPDADGMFFTPDGAEQATRASVAAQHAARYVRAGAHHVADMTAGIGSDSRAFAQAGLRVSAIEKDSATATIAALNLREFPQAQVIEGDSIALLGSASSPDERLSTVDGIYADPARRTAAGRRHHIDDYLPRFSDVLALRSHTPRLGMKVGPAIDHHDIPLEAEAQWVSVDGSVVEAGLWFGDLRTQPGASALVMRDGQAHECAGAREQVDTGSLAEFVVEPDPAVIRAGLINLVAEQIHGTLLHPEIAYLSTSSWSATPFARAYRVTEQMPYSVKNLKAYTTAHSIGRLDIKKRGIDITPEQLRPQLRLKGTHHATVILTRMGDKRVSLVVEPIND